MSYCDFSVLRGLTLTSVDLGADEGGDTMTFRTTCGRTFKMFHTQSCCENVRIEDTCGELFDLIGSPIVEASEVSSQEDVGVGSQTWTFYRLSTVKGTVTIRWLGESNGHYSESVDFSEIKNGGN